MASDQEGLLEAHFECDSKRAASVSFLLQELWKWLQDNNIVQRLLRTGLHHKQYMKEVSVAFQRVYYKLSPAFVSPPWAHTT